MKEGSGLPAKRSAVQSSAPPQSGALQQSAPPQSGAPQQSAPQQSAPQSSAPQSSAASAYPEIPPLPGAPLPPPLLPPASAAADARHPPAPSAAEQQLPAAPPLPSLQAAASDGAAGSPDAAGSKEKHVPGVTFPLEPVYSTTDGRYRCQWCGQICTTRKIMRRHQTRSKACVELQVKAGRQPHPCTICQRMFWQRESLEYHMQWSHTKVRGGTLSARSHSPAAASAASAHGRDAQQRPTSLSDLLFPARPVQHVRRPALPGREERAAQLRQEMQRLRTAQTQAAPSINVDYQCAVCGWQFRGKGRRQGGLAALRGERRGLRVKRYALRGWCPRQSASRPDRAPSSFSPLRRAVLSPGDGRAHA